MLFETSRNRIERRRGPDFWMKFINWVAVGGWVLMFAGLIIFGKAKPEMSTFFDRMRNVPIRTDWDQGLINNIIPLMLIILCFCTIGLGINSQRVKRRDDQYNISLIILGTMAGIVIMLFVFYFRERLSIL